MLSPLNEDTNQSCGVRYCHTHINFVLWSYGNKVPHTVNHVIYKLFMKYHLHLLENVDLKCHGNGAVERHRQINKPLYHPSALDCRKSKLSYRPPLLFSSPSFSSMLIMTAGWWGAHFSLFDIPFLVFL